MKDSYLKENVPHITGKRPFSLHHTDAGAGGGLALYMHWHNEIELFYLNSGKVIFYIEDIKIPLSEGEAVLIPPNLLHWAEKVDNMPCSYDAVVFHPELFLSLGGYLFHRFIQPMMFNGKAYILRLSNDDEWKLEVIGLLKSLLAFYGTPDVELWELEFIGIMYQLWNRIYINHFIKLDEMRDYRKLSNKLIRSIDYIHNNYEGKITIQLLAMQSSLSIGVFCRYFKQLSGNTPMNYLSRYRIIKCCELLINSDLKVTDIAFKCGYNNLSYFNREFQKYMKSTPTQYRKANIHSQ